MTLPRQVLAWGLAAAAEAAASAGEGEGGAPERYARTYMWDGETGCGAVGVRR